DKATHQARAARPDPKTKEHRLMREYNGLDEFMASVAGHMSKVGFFLPSDEVLPVGTRVELDLRLKDRTPLITGKGEVRRAHLPHREGDTIPGMDIRFIYIDPSSKEMIRRILAER